MDLTDHRTPREAGRAARWLLLSGLGVLALLVAWFTVTWATEGIEAAGMTLVVSGLPLLLVGRGLLALGAVLGAGPPLLARGAPTVDRLPWLVGAAMALAPVYLHVSSRSTGPPALASADREGVLEVFLRALEAGRLDIDQRVGDPVFPARPTVLRTPRSLRNPRVSGDWSNRMVMASASRFER